MQQLNTAIIPCQRCGDGLGAAYSFIIPKHRNRRDLHVRVLTPASGQFFGPAVRECRNRNFLLTLGPSGRT